MYSQLKALVIEKVEASEVVSMRVFVPFVQGGLARETFNALFRYASVDCLELVETGYDTSAYWWELRRRWNGAEDLLIIEQDVVIDSEVIPSFNVCDDPWCCFQYLGPPGMDFDGSGNGRILRKSLGCTRFSAALQQEIPASMISDKEYFVWHLLDCRVARLLELHGHRPHVHGRVKHVHNYDYDPDFVERDRTKRLASISPALPPLKGGE